MLDLFSVPVLEWGMHDSGGFERLVKEMSVPERKKMLSDLEDKVQVSEEPLLDETEGEEKPSMSPELEYQKFSLLDKLILFFRKVFTGRTREDLVNEVLVKDLGRRLEADIPGMVDAGTRRLASPLFHELDKLRRAAVVFQGPLDKALNHQKQEFFAFLGGREFEAVEQKLQTNLDPWDVYQGNPYHTNQEVKEILEAEMDLILDDIPQEARKRVYQYARTLALLHRLSRFPFDVLLSRFEQTAEGVPGAAEAAAVKDSLAELAEILWNLRTPPSFQTLEALAVFYEQDHLGQGGYDLEGALRDRLDKAGGALSVIRELIHRLPLVLLVRFLLENPGWEPRSFSGGEDWYVLFKKFWKSRLNESYRLFTLGRRRQELDSRVEELLPKGFLAEVRPGERYPHTLYSQSLAAIEGVLDALVLPWMNYYLKILLVDGEFYKQENRQEFTEGYNDLFLVREELEQFREKVSPRGDWGSLLQDEAPQAGDNQAGDNQAGGAQAAGERCKIQDQINQEAGGLAERGTGDLSALNRVLGGVIGGGGQEYDSLSNIDFIAGTENRKFRDELAQVGQALQQGSELIEDMKNSEADMQ